MRSTLIMITFIICKFFKPDLQLGISFGILFSFYFVFAIAIDCLELSWKYAKEK